MAESTWAGLALLAAIVLAAGAFYAAKQPNTPHQGPTGAPSGPATQGAGEPGAEEAQEGQAEPAAGETPGPGGSPQEGQAGPQVPCPLKPLSLHSNTDDEAGLLRLSIEASKPTPCHTVSVAGASVEGDTILVNVSVASTGQFCIQVVSEAFIQAAVPLQDLKPGNYTVILNVDTPQGTCRAPAGTVTVQAAPSRDHG